MALDIVSASSTQHQNYQKNADLRPNAPLLPRPHQINADAAFDHAIWNGEGRALLVGPVASGKTLILKMAAAAAIERGYAQILIVSRSRHIAEQSLSCLRLFRPSISGGLYTGAKKQSAQILFATAPTLARHLDVVESADLVLIDECDQAYTRDSTKEYRAIIAAARRIGGCTGTPFVLEKGRTVPIFGGGSVFNSPCHLITKAELRDAGFFHFIQPAPVTPSRYLKIDRKMKVDPSGDYDTKVQAEQMCGRAQRIFPGKTAAWLLDYGSHGARFGSANWDWPEAIEFDRREKLRIPADGLAEAIRAGHHDPKCETRPDNFHDLFEETVDLFHVVLEPARNARSVCITYVHSLGFTVQRLYPSNGFVARVLRTLGTPRFQGQWANPPADYDELVRDITAAPLPSHLMLRRIFDTYLNKIVIAVVGYTRDGDEYVFDNKPVVTREWLHQRALDREAGYGASV